MNSQPTPHQVARSNRQRTVAHRSPEGCEHASTKLSIDFEWVICGDCRTPLIQNPAAPSIKVKEWSDLLAQYQKTRGV